MNEHHIESSTREINSGNEGLPNGAKKFQDAATAQLLGEVWQQEIDLYKKTGICINIGLSGDKKSIPALKEFGVEISGSNSETFSSELNPKVEGYSWYRGIAVKIDKNNPSKQVFIFSGWMQPWIENGTRTPIVYTIGNVSHETVRYVIYKYTSDISEKIKALEMGIGMVRE